MSKQRELHGNAKQVPLLAARTDEVDVGRFESVEPRELVAVRRDTNQLLTFSLGQKFMLALCHAPIPVHKMPVEPMDSSE